jgi:hypothetical protein
LNEENLKKHNDVKVENAEGKDSGSRSLENANELL